MTTSLRPRLSQPALHPAAEPAPPEPARADAPPAPPPARAEQRDGLESGAASPRPALAPPTVAGAFALRTAASATTPGSARAPADLFDYADASARRPAPERPGYLGGTLRGATYEPVFGEGSNGFTRGLARAGNRVIDKNGCAATDLNHHRYATTL